MIHYEVDSYANTKLITMLDYIIILNTMNSNEFEQHRNYFGLKLKLFPGGPDSPGTVTEPN